MTDRPLAEKKILSELVDLSRALGIEERRLVLLAEGNTSARKSGETFWVKASGAKLHDLLPANITECRFRDLLDLLGEKRITDAQVDERLLHARIDPAAKKPSVEAIFHAYLLTLPGINFIGHVHPIFVNQILCSSLAGNFARRRLFPDEVVCCGVESVLVPYTDPGLKLAQVIASGVRDFIRRLSRPPKVILLQNHGMIALGATPAAVLATTLMAAKSAEIFSGAAALSGIPRFLTKAQVERIAGRPDEHYRQKMLGLLPQ